MMIKSQMEERMKKEIKKGDFSSIKNSVFPEEIFENKL